MESIRRWWNNLGYCWNKRHGEFRSFGIRPFGKRWFWLIVDDSETAVPTGRRASESEDPWAWTCPDCGQVLDQSDKCTHPEKCPKKIRVADPRSGKSSFPF